MAQPKNPKTTPRRRVWRISEAVPLGEFVDLDIASPPRLTHAAPRSGWTISTLDLLHGVDVDDAPDTVPDELFDELFKPPRGT